MLILFDNGTPRGLARFLAGHSVEEARSRGWEELSNGDLIAVAEQAGFEVMITTDKNIRYQQNPNYATAGSLSSNIRNGQWLSWQPKTSSRRSMRRHPEAT